MVPSSTRSLLLVLTATASLVGCTNKDKDAVDSDTDTFDSDTGTPDVCGDGVVTGLEDCDFGENNAADGNCLLDCSLNDDQVWAMPLGDLPANAYDAVGVASGTAPMGTGAWQPSDTNLTLDTVAKFELHIPMYDFRDDPALQGVEVEAFPELGQLAARDLVGEIAVSDIASITFQTRHPAGDQPRYYLYLYTQPDGIDDGASWYGRSLLAYTNSASGLDAPDDTWVTFSTTGTTNLLMFRDKDVDQFGGNTVLAPLADLTAGPYTWSSGDTDDSDTSDVGPFNYGAEILKYVTIATSSGTATTEFDGLVDAVVIELTDGRSITIDLEP